MNMKRILILPNAYKDEGYAVTRRIVSFLTERGAEVYAKDGDLSFLASAGARALGTLSGALRLIISVGGDGTVLASAGEAIRYGVPLLGVNMGRLGFLAELDAEKIDRLERLFTGEYRITSRMTLSVIGEIDGERTPQSVFPLNDVVLSHDRGEGLMELSLSDGEGNAIDYHADGLILATPSGSTAYSLSAGGPIIDDTVEAICVTPVCPHSFFSRSLVFGRDTRLTVENRSLHGKEVIVSLDGTDALRLPVGGRLYVSRSSSPLQMLTFDRHATLGTLKCKMQMAEMKYRTL
jgi:NAD+ kinase